MFACVCMICTHACATNAIVVQSDVVCWCFAFTHNKWNRSSEPDYFKHINIRRNIYKSECLQSSRMNEDVTIIWNSWPPTELSSEFVMLMVAMIPTELRHWASYVHCPVCTHVVAHDSHYMSTYAMRVMLIWTWTQIGGRLQRTSDTCPKPIGDKYLEGNMKRTLEI